MQVIDFQEEPEPLLLMPYYPDGNLQDLTGIEPWQYVSASRQMLLSLRPLCGNGVVHHDLKPANLFVAVRNPLTTVISDFCFSKIATTDDLLKNSCASKLYGAPEVVPVGNRLRIQSYDASVDIWSAGIITLQFLFGPFLHSDIDHLPLKQWIKAWSNIAVDEVEDVDENNDQAVDLIKHMVVKKPEDEGASLQTYQRRYTNSLWTFVLSSPSLSLPSCSAGADSSCLRFCEDRETLVLEEPSPIRPFS